MMPVSALAADGTSTVENAVAEVTIDGTPKQYTDIVAAFDAAQLAASATVKLLKNVTIPQNADSHSYGIRLKSGDITLDLNGCTIQTTGGESGFVPLYAVFYIEDGSSLTVQDSGNDGKIVQPNGGQAIGVSYGNLTVKSGIIKVTSDSADADNATTTQNCAVFVRGSGVADIQGGTLIGNRGIYVGGEWGGGTLTVSGGTIHGKSSYALEVVGGSAALSGGSYTTGVSDRCSIWNADGPAATLLVNGYRFESKGTECAYSEDGKGVAGNATVAPRPANEYAYIGKAGKLTTQANCTEITESTDDISTPGWYVVKENLTISSLNISGEVDLILCDGATLTVTNYMNVTKGSTLNLYWQSAGSGKLTAAAISVLGTVTAPAGEMKKTTGEGGTTFEKCFEHDWKYTNNGDKHTAKCKLCGKAEAAESHKYDSWAHTDANTHTGTCACGATKTEDHTLTCTPNADGLTHSTKCSVCSYTAAAESHNFDQTDGYGKKCACGAYLAAEYNGQQYASLQVAINAAAADGGTVTLARDVSENATVTGGTLTVDLNRKTWLADISKNPDIWGRIPLTVTGGSVTLENGTLDQGHTSSMGSYGIRIQGGSVTVKGNAVVIGSNTTGSEANISYPAIILESGDLTLETGATLVHGLKVPEDKHLSDYLPEGTAFGLRSYDKATGTWTVGKDLFADAYTTNAYNVPDMALVVVEHTKHDFKLNSDGKYVCACGYTCPHNEFENGVCTICHNGCAHTNVDENGLCQNCKTQMVAKITASDNTVTYGTDFAAAMRNATNGTTVTLLADIKWGVTPKDRAAITGDGKIVTLNLNGHTITGGWFDIGSDKNPTSCTLKIIGEGSHESLGGSGGCSGVFPKATLDLSEWEGGTISTINISDNSNYEAKTREAAVIVGPKAGTIGKLTFGNNQLGELKKTKLSGGSFNEIWAANHQPVKLGELLAEGYAYQKADGSYVEYETTLRGASIYNVKVVKCLHPNMKPDAITGIATCEYCGKSGKFVASVDGNLYTADQWKDAFKAWLGDAEDEKANGILKLYTDYEAEAADATWSVGYRPNGNTLDLNGHRMSVQNDGAFKPTHNMHLTVTDSKEFGQITNILLDGSQDGSFTLERGFVCNLKMTDGAVVTLKGGSVDTLDVQDCSANTNISIQGGSIGKLNITDWAEDMHVSATGGSLGAYNLPSGKILADVLDHQYYATGTSLDKQADAAAQSWEKFVIKQAPYDFGSTSKAAAVPINGSITFMVDSPSENVGVYEVKWYRRTNSGAEHMTENKVAGVNVNDTLDVFCVITGLDRPGGAMQWQVAVKDYTIKVVPARLDGATVTLDHDSFVFDGNSHTPTVTSVALDNKALIKGTDYTVSVSPATNAGTYELIVTGTKNYTGTVKVPWTIEQHPIAQPMSMLTVTKTYDGTATVSTDNLAETDVKFKSIAGITGISEMTLTRGKDFKISGHYDAANVGDDIGADITITLTEGGNYTFKDAKTGEDNPTATLRGIGTITPATVSTEAKPYDLYVVNNLEREYLIDPAKLLPTLDKGREFGTIGYAWSHDSALDTYYGSDFANGVGTTIENDKILLRLAVPATVDKTTEAKIGNVTYTAKTQNYGNITLTVNIKATNKIVPTGKPTLSAKALTYGQALSAIKLSGTMKDGDETVPGTFAWADGTVKPSAGSYEAAWKFTPTDGDTYAETTGTVTITVTKATPSGAPKYTEIKASGKRLADAGLTASLEGSNLFSTPGSIAWVDAENQTTTLADNTPVEQGTAYRWLFTPKDLANYNKLAGTIVLWAKPASGGGGGIVIPVQKPEITTGDGGKTDLSDDGTTIKITPDEGKEVDKVLVNGKDIGAVTEVKDLKPGDKVEVIFKDKIKEPTKEELDSKVKEALNDMTLKARSAKTSKKNIRINVIASITDKLPDGYTVKYKYYRSTKKTSGYRLMTAKSKNYYINTKGTKGTRYYYKARVAVYDNDGKLIAQTELKQCKYAARVWTKLSKSK